MYKKTKAEEIAEIDVSLEFLEQHDIQTEEGLNAVLRDSARRWEEKLKNGYEPKILSESNIQDVFDKLSLIRQRKKFLKSNKDRQG